MNEPIPLAPAGVVASPQWWATRRSLVGAAIAAVVLAVPVVGVLASGDGPVASVGEGAKLPNIGGLHLKKSPSPSMSPGDEAPATPRPSPTTKEERVAARSEQGSAATTESDPVDEEPDPTPEPTKAEPEPTPEPTGGGTPAP